MKFNCQHCGDKFVAVDMQFHCRGVGSCPDQTLYDC